MTTTMEWEGHSIEMRIFFSPRLLMLAADTTLTVAGLPVLLALTA